MTRAVDPIAEQIQGMANDTPTLKAEGAENTPEVSDNPFISSEDLLSLPPTESIVKGLFGRGDICVLVASYGQGKSFLALDMGIRINMGEKWFGMKTKESPLVYVNLEGHLGNRVRAWKHIHGEHPPFTVFEGQPFEVSGVFIDTFIKHCPKRAVVVVDTLAIAAGGLNLDRPEDVTRIYGLLRKIAREINGAVIVVAHLGKDDTRGAAGSHQIEAQADAVLSISKNRNLAVKKARDGEKRPLGGISLEVVHLGEDEDGDPITSCVVKPAGENKLNPEPKPLTKSQEYALESFNKALRGKDCVELEEWRPVFYAGNTADNDESKRQAFYRARRDLVDIKILSVFENTYKRRDVTRA